MLQYMMNLSMSDMQTSIPTIDFTRSKREQVDAGRNF
jgi:hypothetical protein